MDILDGWKPDVVKRCRIVSYMEAYKISEKCLRENSDRPNFRPYRSMNIWRKDGKYYNVVKEEGYYRLLVDGTRWYIMPEWIKEIEQSDTDTIFDSLLERMGI